VSISVRAITGQSDSHIVDVAGVGCVHAKILKPLLDLKNQAAADGLQLAVASGFRSFDRQLAIWNAKVRGDRPVYDSESNLVDLPSLNDGEKVFAILRWSALPGGSRHHWGTDVDVWDPSAVNDAYDLQLVPEEYQDHGPFAPLSGWLDQQIASGGTQFYRPYAQDTGGIAPELWHISFRPLAEHFQKRLSAELLIDVLKQTDIELKDEIVANIDEIFDRFLC